MLSVMLAACLVMLFLIFGVQKSRVSERVTGLQITQFDNIVYATWDDTNMDGYEIRIEQLDPSGEVAGPETDPEKSWLEASKDNSHKIRNLKEGVTYRITVRGTIGQDLSMDDYGEITIKPPQEMNISNENFDGFKGDKIAVDASATGDIYCHIADEKIAVENEKGDIKFLEPGRTKILVVAAETQEFAASGKAFDVTVYPEKLRTPSPRIKELTDSSLTLRWKAIDFATAYDLEKLNPATGEYERVKTVDALGEDGKAISTLEIARDAGKYSLQAKATVRDKTVESKTGKAITVSSAAEKATAYGSSHTIETLNSSNLTTLATITGGSGCNIPQSMSLTEDGYVVSYVNRSGSRGVLICYDRNGNYVKSGPNVSMGHANGSTYNPNTDSFYTVRTHKSIRSSLCTVLDGDSYGYKKKFNLPRTTSGIAYDVSNNKYYLSKGNEIYVTDSDFNVEKFIWKNIRYNHAQDVGAYNGVVLVCTWVSGSKSYVDCYRVSDKQYLGSFSVPIGEIESVVVDDGYLVLLVNSMGTSRDHIYRTKERISFN